MQAVVVRYQRATGAVWRQAHGSVFVLPHSASDIAVLTGTGQDLWWLLEEPLTVDQAAHRLAGTYGVPSDTVRRDLGPVVDDLAGRGVLEVGQGWT